MKFRPIALLLLGVVGCVAVAACGGGSSSSSASSASGGSFASTAEAACTAAGKQISALGTPQQAQVLAYLEQTEEVVNTARNENFDAVREISDELIGFEVGALAEAAKLKSCAEVPEATS